MLVVSLAQQSITFNVIPIIGMGLRPPCNLRWLTPFLSITTFPGSLISCDRFPRIGGNIDQFRMGVIFLLLCMVCSHVITPHRSDYFPWKGTHSQETLRLFFKEDIGWILKVKSNELRTVRFISWFHAQNNYYSLLQKKSKFKAFRLAWFSGAAACHNIVACQRGWVSSKTTAPTRHGPCNPLVR